MKKQVVTQKSKIQAALTKGQMLSPTQLKARGIKKPSARICELRKTGLQILSTKNTRGKFAWKLAQTVAEGFGRTESFGRPAFA